MASIRLADGSTFTGFLNETDMAKAIEAYASAAKTVEDATDAFGGIFEMGKVTISPNVTKIVEKAVQVPILPDRPLTKEEMVFLTKMAKMRSRENLTGTLLGIGVSVAIFGGITYFVYKASRLQDL